LLNNNLYVALIHYPVINKKGQPVGSALTTIDLHDIARASLTFGVNRFFVVTPYKDQIELANELIEHWTKGVGGTLNPDRKQALELIRVTQTFEQAAEQIKQERNQPVVAVATSARQTADTITIDILRKKLENAASHVLVFGTAWGLADELIEQCDYMLAPILGDSDYNHLSVRSAASIYLDRIINGR
jgi:hypothetical protein